MLNNMHMVDPRKNTSVSIIFSQLKLFSSFFPFILVLLTKMLLSLVAYVSDYHVKSLTLRIYLYYSSKNTSIPLKWGKMSSIFNSLLKKSMCDIW